MLKIKKNNITKICVVVFLTILIWIYADRAIETTYTVTNASLNIARSLPAGIWVTFPDSSESVTIQKIDIKGPRSRINEFNRKYVTGSIKLDFFIDPAENDISPGKFDVLDFLRDQELISQFGLTVNDSEPQTVDLEVIKLAKKKLDIVAIDENQQTLKTQDIDPPEIEMFVPADWQGENLRAFVKLDRSEIEQARQNPVNKKPYVNFVPGHIKISPNPVKITLAAETEQLPEQTVTSTTLGIILSPVLQEKYRVEIVNLQQLLSAISVISIRATDKAKQAFEMQPYQVLLAIEDSDKDQPENEPIRRKLIYNFPQQYLQTSQIELRQQPVTAQFKLIPLAAPKSQ
jgi:hypothetical protein